MKKVRIHPFRLLGIWLLTILIAIMATSWIASAGKEEVKVEYKLMTEQEYQDYEEEYEGSEEIENKLQSKLEESKVGLGEFKITAYCPCEKCCGKWADGYTSSGDKATEGITIAADWSILPEGTILDIDGVGERIIQDTGGAIKGKRLDLYFEDHQAALNFGFQKLEVWEVINVQ